MCIRDRELKELLADSFSFFDKHALDAARFMYGNAATTVYWKEGTELITDFLHDAFAEWDEQQDEIPEGSRNQTMSRYAGRLVVRLGGTEEAYEMFSKKAELCNPPLPEEELDSICLLYTSH